MSGQETEELMDCGIAGTGEGFDARSAGKIGGRWCNPSQSELRSAMLAVLYMPMKAACLEAHRNLLYSGVLQQQQVTLWTAL